MDAPARGIGAERRRQRSRCGGARNLDTFVKAVDLDPLETEIFRFVFHTDRDATFERLCTNLVETRAIDTLGLTALCLRRTPTEVWERMLRGPLHALRLVDVASGATDRFTFFVPYRIVGALTPPNETVADMERALIGESLAAQVHPAAYDHVAQERDFVLRLLRGVGGPKGVNILLYGGPGTGKSEFCRWWHRRPAAICLRSERQTRAVMSLRAASGWTPSAWRTSWPRAAARRCCCSTRWRISCSVASEPAPGGTVRRAGSKVFFNRLLEQNQVPVLWTANAIDEFDPALFRRMTFAFEMKALPAAGRARLWERPPGARACPCRRPRPRPWRGCTKSRLG